MRCRVEMRGKMIDRVDWMVLKWLGRVERMNGDRLTEIMYNSEVVSRKD